MTIKFLSVSVTPPPLDVQILIKKGEYKIYNEARVCILHDSDSTQEFHCDDLLSHGYNLWQFVNEEDEAAYNLKGESNE